MMPKLGVLLGSESAIPAKNMAIMYNIVEVLKKVSLVGEVEHVRKETRSKDIDVPSSSKPLTKWTKSQGLAHRRRVQMMNTHSR